MTTPVPSSARTWVPDVDDCIRINGRQCHVLDRGQGPPVVILHGLGSLGMEIALPLLPLGHHYRLIIPDRPGYGASASLLRPEKQVDWLRDVLTHSHVERPIIVAHSIAAAVALGYALRFPDDIAGLVLIAPFCRPTHPALLLLLRLVLMSGIGRIVRNWMFSWLAGRVGRKRFVIAFGPDDVPDYLDTMPLDDLVKSEALSTMAAELSDFNPAMKSYEKYLFGLTVPTAILAGEADEIAKADRHAAWLAERLPNAQLIRLPGIGHMLHHANPQVVIQAIDDIASTAERDAVAA